MNQPTQNSQTEALPSTASFSTIRNHNTLLQFGYKSLVFIVLSLSSFAISQAREVTLTWNDNSDNEAGFIIERSNNGETFALIAQTEANVSTYIDRTTRDDVDYAYRVKAFNATGSSGYTNKAAIRASVRHYIGQIAGSTTGNFSLTANDKGGVTLFGTSGAFGDFSLESSIQQNQDGSFEFESDLLGPITATIDDGRLTASALGGLLSFSGDRIQANKRESSLQGIFNSVILHSPDGVCKILLSPDGTAKIDLTYNGRTHQITSILSTENSIEAIINPGIHLSLNYSEGDSSFRGTLKEEESKTLEIVPVPNKNQSSKLTNASIRAQVSSNEKTMIAGLTLVGEGKKHALLRAIGPTLGDVAPDTNFLSDPSLNLYKRQTPLPNFSNDDWGNSTENEQLLHLSNAVGAFPLEDDSSEAAISVQLSEGSYTAHIQSAIGAEGTALFEFYDIDEETDNQSTTNLTNLSLRGEIGSADEVVIVGFAISGDSPKKVLLRAVCSELRNLGVTGPLTADPEILLFALDQFVTSNDNWEDGPTSLSETEKVVGAFPLEPNSNSAALEIWLNPGIYSAIVLSQGGTKGIALVELYDIPNP